MKVDQELQNNLWLCGNGWQYLMDSKREQRNSGEKFLYFGFGRDSKEMSITYIYQSLIFKCVQLYVIYALVYLLKKMTRELGV
jgi:hypothetical protein